MTTLSEVKARLSEIAEDVATTHERVHVTRNGRVDVVLLAAEDLESLEGTLELLSDRAAQARVVIAERDIELGHVLDERAVRALLSGPTSSLSIDDQEQIGYILDIDPRRDEYRS